MESVSGSLPVRLSAIFVGIEIFTVHLLLFSVRPLNGVIYESNDYIRSSNQIGLTTMALTKNFTSRLLIALFVSFLAISSGTVFTSCEKEIIEDPGDNPGEDNPGGDNPGGGDPVVDNPDDIQDPAVMRLLLQGHRLRQNERLQRGRICLYRCGL